MDPRFAEKKRFLYKKRCMYTFFTYFLIRGSNVSRLRLATGTKKLLLLSSSMPPKTHWPSTRRPRLYFLLPNFDSSIWTRFPTPPIGAARSKTISKHSSLWKLYQSTVVWLLNSISCDKYVCGTPKIFSFSIFLTDKMILKYGWIIERHAIIRKTKQQGEPHLILRIFLFFDDFERSN